MNNSSSLAFIMLMQMVSISSASNVRPDKDLPGVWRNRADGKIKQIIYNRREGRENFDFMFLEDENLPVITTAKLTTGFSKDSGVDGFLEMDYMYPHIPKWLKGKVPIELLSTNRRATFKVNDSSTLYWSNREVWDKISSPKDPSTHKFIDDIVNDIWIGTGEHFKISYCCGCVSIKSKRLPKGSWSYHAAGFIMKNNKLCLLNSYRDLEISEYIPQNVTGTGIGIKWKEGWQKDTPWRSQNAFIKYNSVIEGCWWSEKRQQSFTIQSDSSNGNIVVRNTLSGKKIYRGELNYNDNDIKKCDELTLKYKAGPAGPTDFQGGNPIAVLENWDDIKKLTWDDRWDEFGRDVWTNVSDIMSGAWENDKNKLEYIEIKECGVIICKGGTSGNADGRIGTFDGKTIRTNKYTATLNHEGQLVWKKDGDKEFIWVRPKKSV